MQGLVYIFIGLMGAGLGVASYFLLATTPIEAGLVAMIVTVGGMLVNERTQRRRAEARLQKGIEEMARLLKTDAKAGQVLSQRVNAIADLDLGPRLEVIEADMSVLGTVVRQVAEAVSELEAAQPPSVATESDQPRNDIRMPSVSIETVRRAIDAGQLLVHAQPIVTLPQRKLHAYDLVPRLWVESGKLVSPPEYMPIPNAEGRVVIRRIERICAEEGIKIVRRARLGGDPVRLIVQMSLPTLDDTDAIHQLTDLLSGHRAVNPDICFALDYADWTRLERHQIDSLKRLVQQGVGLALREVTTLRLDFAELSEQGIRMLMLQGESFLRAPAKLTDFHSSDITDYVRRFGINLVMTGLTDEQQILALLDDGAKLAQGEVIAPVGPLRRELIDDDEDDLRQSASR